MKTICQLLLCIASVSLSVQANGEELAQWFALGSGCRAKFDIPGDVIREDLPANPNYPGYQHIRFSIKQMALRGVSQVAAGRDFARECAIRLKVEPDSSQKISGIIAETKIAVSKPKGVSIVTSSELKLGQATLDLKRESVVLEADLKNAPYDIRLITKNHAEIEGLKCGEPKIAGFDYTWIASTSLPSPKELEVSLSGDRALDFYVKFDTCNSPIFNKKKDI